MFLIRNVKLFAIVLLFLGAAATPVQAHALSGDCRIRGNKVHVEGFYSDDTPAAFAAIRVLDADGKKLTEGKMDAEGFWQFDRPAPGNYTVIIETDGHRKQLSIRVPGESGFSGRISTELTREEFTAFPWAKVVIGLATIGILSGAILLARRQAGANGK